MKNNGEKIINILKSAQVTTEILEPILDKLNHESHIIPLGRYLLNRPRHPLKIFKHSGA